MDKVKIYTFGCKVNTHDTSVLEKKLMHLNPTTPLHIINTCAVTRKASLEAVKLARKIKKNTSDKVVITGCAAQVDTEDFNTDIADLVVANSDKDKIDVHINNMFTQSGDTKIKSDIFKKNTIEPTGGLCENRTRAFVKIQDGCNSFCTFCVIPFARGKSRSLSIDSICKQINNLHYEGIKEVVLTGVHIGDYADKDKGLEDLVESVLLNTKIPRIRLTSLEPKELSTRLIDLYSDKRMCPHFHMSIQSLNNRILKKMRRQYEVKDITKAFSAIDKNINNPFVGMDLIVGFVSEDRSEFNQAHDLLANLPWTKIHVFPYSHRPHTRASKLKDDVLHEEKKYRSKVIRKLSQQRLHKKAQEQIGTQKNVLILKNQKGLSRDYWECVIDNNQHALEGEFPVVITGYKSSILSGKDGALEARLA